MHYPLLTVVLGLFFTATVLGGEVNGPSQPRICPNLPVKGGGCVRYVRGFDVTGVVTEVDLIDFEDPCACIKACLDRPDTCNNYVWKFSTTESVRRRLRTCTLYSNFNLPPNVTVVYNTKSNKNVNIQLLSPTNNPQAGALAPEAFKDVNLNKTFDPDALSGPVWALEDGSVVC